MVLIKSKVEQMTASLKAGGTLDIRRSVLGRLFQMVGPQTEKARWLSCVRVRWTMAARDVVERRHRRWRRWVPEGIEDNTKCNEFQILPRLLNENTVNTIKLVIGTIINTNELGVCALRHTETVKKLSYRRETARQLHTSSSGHSLIVHFTEHCICFTAI